MKYAHFYGVLTLFTSCFLTGMDLTAPTKGNKNFIQLYNTRLLIKQPTKESLIFQTDENPPQQIKIPLDLAQQCNKIKDMFDDIPLQEPPVELLRNTNTENALHFISYLKKIQHESTLPKKSNEWKIYIRLFASYIRSLNTTELMQLAHNIDYFDVVDQNNHYIITSIIANEIRNASNNIEKIKCFTSLNGKAIFRSIMQKLNKDDKLDTKIIQPYVDTLTEQSSLPRTDWRLMSLCTKIYNCFSWDTIRYKPYYLNTQTGTIIKSTEIVDDKCKTIQTNSVTIFKKNGSPVIIKLTNIKKITHISANADESLFICESTRQTKNSPHARYCVINLNNPEKLPQFYHACAFTQNNNELYIGKGKDFGIQNIITNTFTPIDLKNDDDVICNIATNKNGTIFAVSTQWELFIGRKNSSNLIAFDPVGKALKDHKYITNICFNPFEDNIYIETKKSFLIINLTTFNTILAADLPDWIIRPTHIGFPSKDILFLGYDILKANKD